MKRSTWKDYFTFSKKERVAVFILLVILIAVIVLPYFYSYNQREIIIDDNLNQQLALLSKSKDTSNVVTEEDLLSQPYQPSVNANVENSTLFTFDPNSLDQRGWKKLGVHDKVIKTIMNYRNKGGKFKQPEDIKKIYGLKEQDANRLIPYIEIQNEDLSQHNFNFKKEGSTSTYSSKTVSRHYNVIDINTATVEQWKELPGIGDVLSHRIVKFRNKLGGFSSIDQVKQTYGLTDSTFQLIQSYLTISSVPDKK